MLNQNCIGTIHQPETLFPSNLTWRIWLRAGMALAGRQTRQVLAALKAWRNRHRQRRQLAMLPDHILKDIGISRMGALWESEKPFWRR
jgi:uncharacterized protein YjiS (DUF1127 family)